MQEIHHASKMPSRICAPGIAQVREEKPRELGLATSAGAARSRSDLGGAQPARPTSRARGSRTRRAAAPSASAASRGKDSESPGAKPRSSSMLAGEPTLERAHLRAQRVAPSETLGAEPGAPSEARPPRWAPRRGRTERPRSTAGVPIFESGSEQKRGAGESRRDRARANGSQRCPRNGVAALRAAPPGKGGKEGRSPDPARAGPTGPEAKPGKEAAGRPRARRGTAPEAFDLVTFIVLIYRTF